MQQDNTTPKPSTQPGRDDRYTDPPKATSPELGMHASAQTRQDAVTAANNREKALRAEVLMLKRQLAQSEAAYHAVTSSTFWRITGPMRRTMDILKDGLRGNRAAQAVWNGQKRLRQGLAWRKQGRGGLPGPVPQELRFSILVPLYNTPERYLSEMIASVQAQTYANWELCLFDASDERHDIQALCRSYCQDDPRILYKKAGENSGISENTNRCAQMASGEYLGLLDHDDVLMPNALMENARAILETQADVLYSDEDHLSPKGAHVAPLYKPDWSPDLLYSQMYICHFLVFRRSLFEAVGGFRKEFDGSQDYDLMLRFFERTQRICHIPLLLYSWRESEGSTAANADAKPYAHMAGLRALNGHLRRKYPGAYAEETAYTYVYNPRFALPGEPLVSIVIPMKDHWELTAACLQSIVEKSSYRNYEILLLNNRSEEAATDEWLGRIQIEQPAVRVLEADMEFNWSKLNNLGIAHAKGDVLIFLNNDTLVESADWMQRLAENALRPDVGVVGALLLYPDDTIQHAGVVVGLGGWADHVFKGAPAVHYGSPFVSPMVSRNVLSVTGACMAVSRATLDTIGTFDEDFVICGSDVEMGIRAYEAGLVNRYDANVRLYHLESKSRDAHIPEIDFIKSKEAYAPYRENVDPYFNINLDNRSAIPKERLFRWIW